MWFEGRGGVPGRCSIAAIRTTLETDRIEFTNGDAPDAKLEIINLSMRPLSVMQQHVSEAEIAKSHGDRACRRWLRPVRVELMS